MTSADAGARAPRGRRRALYRSLAGFLRAHPFRGSGRLAGWAGAVLVPAPREPVVAPTVLGFSIRVDPRRAGGLETAIFRDGVYEPGTLDVMARSLRPGDVFLDVGANIGLMSLAAARLVGESGHVHAFEPVAAIHALLLENLRLNGVTNVTAHPFALGAKREERTIFDHAEINRASASLVETSEPRAGERVRLTTADAFASEQRLGPVRMMKIDVEGWELEVLRGARELLSGPNAPILCLEYSQLHPLANGAPPDLYHFVRSVNAYRVFRLARGKDQPSPLVELKAVEELPRHDNLFCFLPAQIAELSPDLFARAAGAGPG